MRALFKQVTIVMLLLSFTAQFAAPTFAEKFENGETFELQDDQKGRDEHNFSSKTEVVSIVPAHTEGVVIDHMRFYSGNYGVKIHITKMGQISDGVSKAVNVNVGDDIWVYENKDGRKKRLKLLNKGEEEVDEPDDENSASTTHPLKINDEDVHHSKVQKQEDCIPDHEKPNPPVVHEAFKNMQSHIGSNYPTIDHVQPMQEEILAVFSKIEAVRHGNERTNKLIAETLVKDCHQYHVPVALALAVMHQESDFNPNAHNKSGATGLMQVIGGKYDIRSNIKAGVKFIKELQDRYSSFNVDPKMQANFNKYKSDFQKHGLDPNAFLVLAAYNWGPINVDHFIHHEPIMVKNKKTHKKVPKIFSDYPFETRNYFASVGGFYDEYKVVLQADEYASK